MTDYHIEKIINTDKGTYKVIITGWYETNYHNEDKSLKYGITIFHNYLPDLWMKIYEETINPLWVFEDTLYKKYNMYIPRDCPSYFIYKTVQIINDFEEKYNELENLKTFDSWDGNINSVIDNVKKESMSEKNEE